MKKTLLFVAIALIVGLVVGFFVGRAALERQWSQPYSQVSPSTERSNPSGDPSGNPSPKAGTRVLKPMPIGKSRAALLPMTERDAVRSNVGAVGAGDDGVELHVVVENHGACTLTSLSGVAYGFDAFGKPAALLKGGENFVAFASNATLEPGSKTMVAEPLKDAEDATLAIAHIDRTTCADGTSWTRQ